MYYDSVDSATVLYVHSLLEQRSVPFAPYTMRLLHSGHFSPVGFDHKANLQSGY